MESWYNPGLCARRWFITQTRGIDWKNVTFVIGHREDVTPDHWRVNHALTRDCANCGTKSLFRGCVSARRGAVLCNVCAAQVTVEIEQDPKTLLLYDFPDDIKARLTEMANNAGVAPEV